MQGRSRLSKRRTNDGPPDPDLNVAFGPQAITLASALGIFAPRVDGLQAGHASTPPRGVVALWWHDRGDERVVLPWWIRSAAAARLTWGRIEFAIDKPRVSRVWSERRTTVVLPTRDPALALLFAEVDALPADLATLLDPSAPEEARAVVRDYALEAGLSRLSAALSAPPDALPEPTRRSHPRR